MMETREKLARIILSSSPTKKNDYFLSHGAFHSKCCIMNKKDLVKQVTFVSYS